MEELKKKIEELLTSGGFDYSVSVDESVNKAAVFVHDKVVSEKNLPKFLADLEHVVKTMAKKLGLEKVSVDVNNYKKERESLIAELAKAAARKAIAEKKEVSLPVMNAYERRLVHLELSTRPDVKTESIGEGAERHIVVKPI